MSWEKAYVPPLPCIARRWVRDPSVRLQRVGADSWGSHWMSGLGAGDAHLDAAVVGVDRHGLSTCIGRAWLAWPRPPRGGQDGLTVMRSYSDMAPSSTRILGASVRMGHHPLARAPCIGAKMRALWYPHPGRDREWEEDVLYLCG